MIDTPVLRVRRTNRRTTHSPERRYYTYFAQRARQSCIKELYIDFTRGSLIDYACKDAEQCFAQRESLLAYLFRF
jgi:hypothetical protein